MTSWYGASLGGWFPKPAFSHCCLKSTKCFFVFKKTVGMNSSQGNVLAVYFCLLLVISNEAGKSEISPC